MRYTITKEDNIDTQLSNIQHRLDSRYAETGYNSLPLTKDEWHFIAVGDIANLLNIVKYYREENARLDKLAYVHIPVPKFLRRFVR